MLRKKSSAKVLFVVFKTRFFFFPMAKIRRGKKSVVNIHQE